MSSAKMLSIVGAIAVVAGLALAAYQTVLALWLVHNANITPGQTHYLGIIVVGIGAILLIAAEIIGRSSN